MAEITHPPAGGTLNDDTGEKDPNVPASRVPKKISLLLLAACLVVFSGVTLYLLDSSRLLPEPVNPFTPSRPEIGYDYRAEKFGSETEFKEYLAAGGEESDTFFRQPFDSVELFSLQAPVANGMVTNGGASRVSTTNVQVAGIDEPDILKTDGKNMYYAGQTHLYYPVMFDEMLRSSTPSRPVAPTRVIRAFPPAELTEIGSVDQNGEFLLSGNRLIVFNADRLYGYEVVQPEQPLKKWELRYESGNYLETARLYREKLYLVVRQGVNRARPCPSPIFEGVEVDCSLIYHPREPVPVDSLYTAMVVDPQNGTVEQRVSFTGRSRSTVVYMSEDNLYLAYQFEPRRGSFYADFFAQLSKDSSVPESLLARVQEIAGYKISENSKMTEIGAAIEEYLQTLSEDDRLVWENNLENKLQDFFDDHKREYEVSGLVRIELDKMDVVATGAFPGQVLNQFSLDEYEGNLRVATTIGGQWGIGDEQANDVHVLNEKLETIGSATELGLNERIYSARFIADRGYVVTFRQTDPFYVLDLSDPKKPTVAGELKIPGYSAYLHPLSEHLILGIGEQGSQVKASIFDVSDPDQPAEAAKYLLDDYWSEANTNHHAFLLDADHQVFFLPGSRGGYVFSYAGNQLVLKKAVVEFQARRAAYLNDYLYLVGDSGMVVLNEADWEEVNRLEFKN